AGVRGCVEEAVARHHTIFADASHPTVPQDIARL
ncbi:unnamed protein product, partial [marine sediment metagenome]